MDQQLANLLDSFWTSGDPDATRVLADRLMELPAEEVAVALVKFRTALRAGSATSGAGTVAYESATAAFRAFAEALPSLLPDEDTNFPP